MRMTDSMRRREEKKLEERRDIVTQTAIKLIDDGSEVLPLMMGAGVGFAYHALRTEDGKPIVLHSMRDDEFDNETLADSQFAYKTALIMHRALKVMKPLFEKAALDEFKQKFRELVAL